MNSVKAHEQHDLPQTPLHPPNSPRKSESRPSTLEHKVRLPHLPITAPPNPATPCPPIAQAPALRSFDIHTPKPPSSNPTQLTQHKRDPSKVALAYTPTSTWRNRSTFIKGHSEIHSFLTQKWEKEKEYRLRKEVPCPIPIAILLHLYPTTNQLTQTHSSSPPPRIR